MLYCEVQSFSQTTFYDLIPHGWKQLLYLQAAFTLLKLMEVAVLL